MTTETKETIKANEFRIGNLVEIDYLTRLEGQVHQYSQLERVDRIDYDHLLKSQLPVSFPYYINGSELKNIKPVLLTPELLEKCGFEIKEFDDTIALAMDIDSHGSLNVDNPKNVVAIKGKVFLHVIKDKLVFIYGQEHLTTGTEIQYLHQLQNLYFALTGEELTINL